jgi:hypothetical protein
MNNSENLLAAETGTVLPPRDTLFAFAFTHLYASVYAPVTAVVVINHGDFNNVVAMAGSSVSIVQIAG